MLVWTNISRLAVIVAVVCRHAAAYGFGAAAKRLRLTRLLHCNPLSGPDRLRRLFEDLGGTFIKFGQMLALQPDILSFEYCNALFNLLDRVPQFDFSYIDHTFVEEFGRRASDIFDSIDPRPIATASIGQVHVAWLNGRKLAVKVQRPTVQRDFSGDIRLMCAAIRAIRALGLKVFDWMLEPMSEFVAWTREELDFRIEANYMRQHRLNSRDNPRERIPEVLDRFRAHLPSPPRVPIISY